MDREKVMEIGHRIKEIRVALDIKQSELADRIKMSRSYLSEVESGKSKVGTDLLYNLSKACHVNVNFLLKIT